MSEKARELLPGENSCCVKLHFHSKSQIYFEIFCYNGTTISESGGDRMRNVELLIVSLEFIENHLCDEIKTEDVAAACYCSKSTLEKMFRCVNKISVHDYVIRRRMMKAARLLNSCPDRTILEIALECGYNTHESFARAFRQIWNCKPSEFRNMKYAELYPRLRIPMKGEGAIMERKYVDISELYDLFQERRNCFFICCDIKNLMSINEISYKAGDLAIIEAMNRLKEAAGEEDMVFRIGGDEFCILTNSTEKSYADGIAEKIKAGNEAVIEYNECNIPLCLYISVISLNQERVKYDELFTGLHDAIRNRKRMECS